MWMPKFTKEDMLILSEYIKSKAVNELSQQGIEVKFNED
jgi:hypothetical protein